MPFNFSQFIEEYFLNPINYPDKYPPYNVVNTLTFAIVAIVAIYFIYKLLNKHGVRTDEKFYWAVIPYVFLGSIVRVLSDSQALPRSVNIAGWTLYPFITPQIYVLVFLITIASLFLCRKFFADWHSVFSKVGWFFCVLSLLPLVFLFKQFILFAAILAIVAVIAVVLFASPIKTNNIEKMVILSQSFDGAATFVGVQFGGYSEQHIVGNAIFSAFGGPWAFLLIKVLFSIAVVYFLRKEVEKTKTEEVVFISLILTIFGLAPGLRDALRLLAGV